MRRFPQLIIVLPIIRFSSSGAASDPFSSPVVAVSTGSSSSHPAHPSHSPHRPSPIMDGGGRPLFFQASNGIMASIPSQSISSRLSISSHPPHEASRLCVSSLRLAHHLERNTPGHQRWNEGGRSKQTNTKNRKSRNEKRGAKRGEDGMNTTRQRGERRSENERQVSREKATRACDAITHKNDAPHHSRPTLSPVFSSACGPQSIPRPRGVG